MKEFYTYEQQLEKLKNDGLVIIDEDEAIDFLRLEGYYNVINGYSPTFKINNKFYTGTTFDDIRYLYNFDKELRSIVYKYTSSIETHIKARIDKEITDLSAKNFVVAKLYTNGILSATEYTKQTSEIGNEIKILRAERKKKLSADVAELCLCELNELNEIICGYALTSRFDEKLFEEIVEKIVVEDKGKLIFFLKGGITATEEISEKWRCGDK